MAVYNKYYKLYLSFISFLPGGLEMKSGFMNRTIFLLFFSFSFVLAQSYSTLFIEHIPQNLKESPKSLKMLDQKFSYYSEINPALIYHFIIYLNKTELNDRIKALKYLNTLTNESIQKTNLWLDSEVKYTNSKSISFENWIKLQYFFYKKKNTSKIDSSLTKAPYIIDENLKDYFIYLFLTKEIQNFDRSVDYENKISISLNNTISIFKDANTNYINMPDSKRKKIIELAKTHFYLFADAPNFLSNKNMDINFSKFITNLMKLDNLEQNVVSLSTGFNAELNHKTNNTYFDKEGSIDIKRSDQVNTNLSNQIYIGLGGRIKLKKYKSYLSHINIYGSYSVFSQKKSDITNLQVKKTFIDTINYKYKTITASYTSPIIKDFYAKVFGLSLSTPVYVWNNIYFDFGVLYRSITYKYNYSYSRSDEFTYSDGNQEDLVNSKKNIEFKESLNKFDFVVGFNIDLFKYVTFRINKYNKNINYDLYLHYPL
jgi:hypothetical protein